MKLHKDSHLDHSLSTRQLAHILVTFESRDSFFIETITLPDALGTVACGLYGPIMGDRPILDEDTYREKRGDRPYESRMLRSGRLGWDSVHQTKRYVNTISVIAGPHDGHACVLYTAFGGPLTPREPGDIRAEMKKLEEVRAIYFRAIQVNPQTHSEEDLAKLKADEKTAHEKIIALRPKREESDKFWSEHALVSL